MKTKYTGITILNDTGEIQVRTTYKGITLSKKFGKDNITNMRRALLWLDAQKTLIETGKFVKEEVKKPTPRLKDALSSVELREKYKDLIYSMFPNIPKSHLYRFTILVKKPHINVFLKDEKGNVLFTGVAMCSPEDRWDERTGITLALTRLRISINSYGEEPKENNKKVWIPNMYERYYSPFLHGHAAAKKLTASEHLWHGDQVDLIRLSLGNIYRTKREAIKAGKRMILDGRKLIKENRNVKS